MKGRARKDRARTQATLEIFLEPEGSEWNVKDGGSRSLFRPDEPPPAAPGPSAPHPPDGVSPPGPSAPLPPDGVSPPGPSAPLPPDGVSPPAALLEQVRAEWIGGGSSNGKGQSSFRDVRIDLYPYSGLRSTIRVRSSVVHIRISDILWDAPLQVLVALCNIMMCKMVDRGPPAGDTLIYREYILGEGIRERMQVVRAVRGRKVLSGARGVHHDLDLSFERVRNAYFDDSMVSPTLTWSPTASFSLWGHYDPAHHTISISRALDDPAVPEYVVDHIMYHELLHTVHGVEVRGARRSVHTRAFKEAQKRYAYLREAEDFLRTFQRKRHRVGRKRKKRF